MDQYQAAELIQINELAGDGRIYHNTIGLFPTVAIAKAYAEARSVDSMGRTPLYWLDTTKGKTGNGWAAYINSAHQGTARWQIIWVAFDLDEHLLEAPSKE